MPITAKKALDDHLNYIVCKVRHGDGQSTVVCEDAQKQLGHFSIMNVSPRHREVADIFIDDLKKLLPERECS